MHMCGVCHGALDSALHNWKRRWRCENEKCTRFNVWVDIYAVDHTTADGEVRDARIDSADAVSNARRILNGGASEDGDYIETAESVAWAYLQAMGEKY